MKHANADYTGVAIDWTISQALGGHQVDSEAYRLRASHEDNLRVQQNALKSKCAEAESLQAKLNSGLDEPIDYKVECDDLLAEAQTTLSQKARGITRAENSQEAFRLRHGITREPITSKTAQNMMFLMILVFVEAGINASFFQNAYMVASPFAALLTSLLISVTNVLVCACAGYYIGRWKDYGLNAVDANSPVFTYRRNQARFLFWCFIGVMGFFHATVGLVRALESLESVHHAIVNYKLLLTTPEAVFLVLTGSCLSVLAYQKGKHAFGDPYPEYGELHETVYSLHDDLLDAFDDLTQQIEERFDDAIHMLEKSGKNQRRSIAKYNHCVESCLKAKRDLECAVGKAESQIQMQLSQIANHHRAARGSPTQNSEKSTKHLVSFENFLNFKIPAFHHPPDMKGHKARLAEDKARAFNSLNTIFQEIFEDNVGAKS